LQEVTDVDIATEIADYVVGCVKGRVTAASLEQG